MLDSLCIVYCTSTWIAEHARSWSWCPGSSAVFLIYFYFYFSSSVSSSSSSSTSSSSASSSLLHVLLLLLSVFYSSCFLYFFYFFFFVFFLYYSLYFIFVFFFFPSPSSFSFLHLRLLPLPFLLLPRLLHLSFNHPLCLLFIFILVFSFFVLLLSCFLFLSFFLFTRLICLCFICHLLPSSSPRPIISSLYHLPSASLRAFQLTIIVGNLRANARIVKKFSILGDRCYRCNCWQVTTNLSKTIVLQENLSKKVYIYRYMVLALHLTLLPSGRTSVRGRCSASWWVTCPPPPFNEQNNTKQQRPTHQRKRRGQEIQGGNLLGEP